MPLPTIKIPFLAGLLLITGSMNAGITLSYPSPTATEIQDYFHITDMKLTMFNVSAFICCIFGSIIINFIIPFFGYPICICAVSFLYAISCLMIGLSKAYWLLMFARCLNGLFCGTYSTLIPVSLINIAPPQKVNFYGFFYQVGLTIGFLLPAVFQFFADFRLNAYLCMIPSFILMCGALFLPNAEEKDEDPLNKPNHAENLIAVFHYPIEILTSFLLMFFLQFSGMNAIMSNLQPIIDSSSIGMKSSIIATLASCSQILSTLFATYIVDKLGNRICWTLSSGGQCIAFALLFVQQKFDLPTYVFLIGLFLEQITFGIGTGPIPFALTAQLFSEDISPYAVGICTGVSWLLSAVIVFLWPVMEDNMGLAYSFLFFAIIEVLAVIFGLLRIKSRKVLKEEKEQANINLKRSVSESENICEKNTKSTPIEV